MSLFDTGASAVADPFLRRAYELAELARGETAPNPLVGCVIVRDGAIVGEGHHVRAGLPHAEAVALEQAGTRALGATAYVTLEPCTHEGRTPPCAPALVRAGVARVVIGMRDPNPAVTGRGAEYLRARDVEVSFAADDSPMRRQNEAWLARLTTGRPFVRVKIALTLDGHLSMAQHRRSRITGSGGQQVTMLLRQRAGAIAVGASTVAVDDPELTVRDVGSARIERQRLRVILSRTSIPTAECHLISDGLAPTLVIASDAADDDAVRHLQECGVRVARYPLASGIAGALVEVALSGVDDLLVEAGPGLLTALYDARCIDELVTVHAGGVAGPEAPAAFLGPRDGESATLVLRYVAIDAAVIDGDAAVVWRPVPTLSDTHAEAV